MTTILALTQLRYRPKWYAKITEGTRGFLKGGKGVPERGTKGFMKGGNCATNSACWNEQC